MQKSLSSRCVRLQRALDERVLSLSSGMKMHVAACADCRFAVHLSSVLHNDGGVSDACSIEEELAPGVTRGDVLLLDRYRLLECLGQGGQGRVYLAEDVKMRDTHVALKIVYSDQLSVDEAVNGKRVKHQNVCRINYAQEYGSVCLIEMEYIEGPTLSERLDELSPGEAKAIFLGLCEGMIVVHEHNILHLDLKPQNIMLRAGGIPVVMDFGLSARRGEPARGWTHRYMAPELRTGAPPDVQADVYSLGIILSELMPSPPRALRAVIKRATAQRQQERYQNVKAMQRAYHHALSSRRRLLCVTSSLSLAVVIAGAAACFRPSVTVSGSGTLLYGVLSPLRDIIEELSHTRLVVPQKEASGAEQDGGSENALFMALRGSAHLAAMSHLTTEPVETEPQFKGKVVVGAVIAIDRVAFFVNDSNPVESLPLATLRKLLFAPERSPPPGPALLWSDLTKGSMASWPQLNQPVNVIHPRLMSSGTVVLVEQRLALPGTVMYEHPWHGKSIRDIHQIPKNVAIDLTALGISTMAFAAPGARAVPIVDERGQEVSLTRPLVVYAILPSPPDIPDCVCRVLKSLLSEPVQQGLRKQRLDPISSSQRLAQERLLGLDDASCRIKLEKGQRDRLKDHGLLLHEKDTYEAYQGRIGTVAAGARLPKITPSAGE